MFELCDKEIVESIMNNKKNKELSLTTYALGIERLIYGIIDKNRDDKGIKWPEKINFIKYSIIPTRTDSNKLNNFCEKMEKKLTNRKNLVLYDDRKRTNVSDKVAFSDQIGIRAKYIVGIDKKEKIYVQYEKRGSKIRTKINMEDFLG